MTTEVSFGGGGRDPATDEQRGINNNIEQPQMLMESALPLSPPHKEAMAQDDKAPSQSQEKNRGLAVAFLVSICVVIAVLVALLPNWGGNNDDNSQSSSSSTTTTSQTSSFFESTDGSPLKARLPVFSSNITQTYGSRQEAQADLEQLARLLLNGAILEGVHQGMHTGGGMDCPTCDFATEEGGGPVPVASVPEGGDAAFADATGESSGSGNRGDGSAFGDASDFETYNQEEGVVRSDMVKSDGTHVFAATEDRILVWNLQGELVHTLQLPAIEYPDGVIPPGGPYPVEPFPLEPVPIVPEEVDGVNGTTTQGGEKEEETVTVMDEARSSMIWWNPQPYIQALLLDAYGERLTAIVGGYGAQHMYNGNDGGKDEKESTPVIFDYLGTRIIVYSIDEGGILTELFQTDVHGNHVDSYSVGSTTHLVTKATLNTYDHLFRPIQRWNPEFEGMTDEEYQAAAVIKAESLIGDFVSKILDLVTVEDQVILSHLSVFADSLSGVNNDDERGRSLFYNDFIADSISQVISFDARSVESDGDLVLSTSATMQPGYWSYVYATKDWLWVANLGWSWLEEEGTYTDTTMLLGFRLDGPSSTFAAVGSVPGSLLSQFAIDFVAVGDTEFVRVATTLNFGSGWFMGFEEDSESETTSDNAREVASRTKNQVFVLEIPTDGDELLRRGTVELGKKDEVGLMILLGRVATYC